MSLYKMNKIIRDVASRSSPKDAIALWSIAPQWVDIPDDLSILATEETEEFLHEYRNTFKSLTIFVTSGSPQHIPNILPFCMGDHLTYLDIRSTGLLDCYVLRYLSNLETLYINAMHVKRFGRFPGKIRDLHVCISSRLHIDATHIPCLESLHITADRAYIHKLPEGLKTFRLRGHTCDIPQSLPETLEHLEISGAILDAFPRIPEGVKTLNISNTHMEPGQINFREYAFDSLIAYGTCLENDDIEDCRAKILDIRWTSITPDIRFHKNVNTVYMDMVPTKNSISETRDHILTIHVGKRPEHLSPACTVIENNRLDENGQGSPFENESCYVRRYDRYKVVCKIWTPTLSFHDIDRLLELQTNE
jgi:hypothetical protein